MNEFSAPPKASKQAIWSLVLGILSITCLWILGSIPAIILGVLGMKKADADPARVGGKGMALAGLICGCVGIIAGLIPVATIVGAFAAPGIQDVRERAYQTKEISNARQVLLAVNIYAADNDGKFPDTLQELIPEYIEDDAILYARRSPSAPPKLFLYRSGLYSTNRSNEPMILSPIVAKDGDRVVGFVGGHVLVVPDEEVSGIVEKFE